MVECQTWPIPVAVRSKAYVCNCSIAGIAGSNPAENMAVRLFCVSTAICDELITHSEESHLMCMCVCVGGGCLIMCAL